MALLGTTLPSTPELPLRPPIFRPLPSAPPANFFANPQQVQARLPSRKLPRGRRLSGEDHVVYDVDTPVPGEAQPPQLEVTPITKYLSDPGLVLGRQIAVNRTYICYGLKQGTVRVLNINTALRSLLKGHTQRVTDMSFFAEDVPLLASASVEGRVFVWKINEGPDEENKPQITGKVVVAIQMAAGAESYQPRICWHPHKQEVLVVGMGKYVLQIYTTIVGKCEEFSAEEPIVCSIDKLIDGVEMVGEHEGEVTDLSMSQWMTTRLVSASKDGTVKVWDDRKLILLATLRPHDGQPVYSAAFLTSPQRPEHIVLITAGPLNRELKIWTSADEEGWILPSDSESWQCTQTLCLISSAEPQLQVAFFNQVVVLPQASLILLANAKKNTIYAVHVDYGRYPAATRMDSIADFTVTMPILSLTGTMDSISDAENVVQVFCVQTQAIQQYALDLFQCLPPLVDNLEEKDSCISRVFEAPMSQGFSVPEPSRGSTIHDLPIESPSPKPSAPPLPGTNVDFSHVASSTSPFSLELPGRLGGMRSFPRDFDPGNPIGDCDAEHQALDYSSVISNLPSVTSLDSSTGKEESKEGASSNLMFMPGGNTTHLITPSEILSGNISSSESNISTQGLKSGESHIEEVGVSGESSFIQYKFLSQEDSQTMESGIETEKECCALETEAFSAEKAQPGDSIVVADTLHQTLNDGEEVQGTTNGLPKKATGTAASTTILPPLLGDGKKQLENYSQGSAVPSPSSSPLDSTNSSTEPESTCPSEEPAFLQLMAMQEMLNQLMTAQKEMQKQMSTMVSAPINKEGKRVELALGRSMEKTMKANVDALWSHFHEENAKRDRLERDHIQQVTSIVTNLINKDLPAVLEKTIKKEISGVAPVITRAANPAIEKSVSFAIGDSFQRGVGDKAVNQLEKSVNSKLETTVARQIQTQFQTSGKQALQDGLRSSLESTAIPAFDKGCKVMFDQVSAAFQKGMTEHTTAALQQVESSHTPFVLTLKEALSSASSITQELAGELIDGQRKLLALVTAGNAQVLNPMAMLQSSAPSGVRLEMLEEPLDPRKELTRLISERKFEEAFTSALQRSDVSIVSWLCSQVDLHGMCSMVPLPLSQGVLLSLLHQLACDVSSETSRKVEWMRDVAATINPADPVITPHVRPIFEQVYNKLLQHRSLPTTTTTEAMGIQVTLHVINSLMSGK